LVPNLVGREPASGRCARLAERSPEASVVRDSAQRGRKRSQIPRREKQSVHTVGNDLGWSTLAACDDWQTGRHRLHHNLAKGLGLYRAVHHYVDDGEFNRDIVNLSSEHNPTFDAEFLRKVVQRAFECFFAKERAAYYHRALVATGKRLSERSQKELLSFPAREAPYDGKAQTVVRRWRHRRERLEIHRARKHDP
jgi:hypothetical protein